MLIGNGHVPWHSELTLADADCFLWKPTKTGNGKLIRLGCGLIWVGLHRRRLVCVCWAGSYYGGNSDYPAHITQELNNMLVNDEQIMSNVVYSLYLKATEYERRQLWGQPCSVCEETLVTPNFEQCWRCYNGT